MPRTIRKRQLRNKKSRKQRGGYDTEKIKKIQTIINDNINELLKELGEPEIQINSQNTKASFMSNFTRKAKVFPTTDTNSTSNTTNQDNIVEPKVESEQTTSNLVAIDTGVKDDTDATTNKTTNNSNDNNSI